MDEEDVEEIIREVMQEHNQGKQFEDRFTGFYQNTINNNLGPGSLRRLIENVSLPSEEQVNEAEN